MTGEQYEHYIYFIRKRPGLLPGIIMLNKVLTLIGYLVYPSLLIYLFLYHDSRLINYVLLPALSFVLVSIFRKYYNKSRPYENPDINTLTKRSKKGHSFPSRHVFSYSLISILLLGVLPIAGVIMLVTCFFLAWVRVILGVHYPVDVIAGSFIGILCGIFTLLL